MRYDLARFTFLLTLLLFYVGATIPDGDGYLPPPLRVLVEPRRQPTTTPTWHTRAPIPTPRQEMPAAVLDPDPTGGSAGRIYVVGGIDASRATIGLTQSYDPATDTWRAETDLPDPVDHLGLAGLNGKVYAAGGWHNRFSSLSNRLYEYDPLSRVWTRKADLPTPRGSHVLVAAHNKLYVVGGVGDGSQARVLEYDPGQNAWAIKAAMTAPREHLAAVAVDGKIYVIGGRWSGVGNVATNEVYDPVLNQWTTLRAMPTPRGGLGAAAVGGKTYVVGGEGPSGTPTRTFPQHEVYDPATNIWVTALPSVTPRHGLAVAGLRGRLFVIAGGPVEGYSNSVVNEVYTPCPGDIDASGRIDTPDLQALGRGWGRQRGDVGYNALLDLDGDHDVDILDVASAASRWGVACS